jgi:hypothetical protein
MYAEMERIKAARLEKREASERLNCIDRIRAFFGRDNDGSTKAL